LAEDVRLDGQQCLLSKDNAKSKTALKANKIIGLPTGLPLLVHATEPFWLATAPMRGEPLVVARVIAVRHFGLTPSCAPQYRIL
jgi:hypothetical protein